MWTFKMLYLSLVLLIFNNSTSLNDIKFNAESHAIFNSQKENYSSQYLISCDSSSTEKYTEFQEPIVIICVSRTSHRYHRHMCQGMRNCTHEVRRVSLSEAKQMNKTACGYCY